MKARGAVRWVGTLVLVAVLSPQGSRAAEEPDAQEVKEIVLPLLRTKTTTYTNVTVTSMDKTKVFILHSGGAGNVFVEDLDDETRLSLGYEPVVPPAEKFKAKAEEVMKAFPLDKFSGGMGLNPAGPGEIEFQPPNPAVVAVGIGIVLFFHFFFSFCAMLICRKAGHEPGLTVWVPLLQIFPLLRAAGMSAWWFLAMLLPLVNLVASILWCFNIVKARGKSLVWAVMLLLPLTNILAFLYLAFSEGESDGAGSPPAMPGLAVRTV